MARAATVDGVILEIATIVALLTLSVPLPAVADAPLMPPHRHTQCSPSGQFCATIDPQGGTFVHRSGEDGELLWSIPKWFRVLYLADDPDLLVTGYDGQNLVPLDAPGDVEVLTFWNRGKVVCAYKLSELVADLGRLQRTASHYHWGSYLGFDGDGNFRVATVQNQTLVFDAARGVLVERLRGGG